MSMIEEQLRFLDVMASGRGRHAAMAMKTVVGSVQVYRGGRWNTGFDLCVAEACLAAGWVRIVESAGYVRYVITPAGRAERLKER